MAISTVTSEDKRRVIQAIDSAPSHDVGLPAVSVGWRCGKAGTRWAETVLEALLIEGKVEKRTVEHGETLSLVILETNMSCIQNWERIIEIATKARDESYGAPGGYQVRSTIEIRSELVDIEAKCGFTRAEVNSIVE